LHAQLFALVAILLANTTQLALFNLEKVREILKYLTRSITFLVPKNT